MIFHEDFESEVKGLFGTHKVSNASISCKLIEECCIKDYLEEENNAYPDWNVQEKGMDWPNEVKTRHSEITQKSLKRTTSRKKIKM